MKVGSPAAGANAQVTMPVTFTKVLSEKLAIAVSCCAWPDATEDIAGEMETELSVTVDGFTVSVVLAENVCPVEAMVADAVITVAPAATSVACPKELIVATPELEEFQETLESGPNVLSEKAAWREKLIGPAGRISTELAGNTATDKTAACIVIFCD